MEKKEIQETTVGQDTTTNNITNTSATQPERRNITTGDIPGEQEKDASDAITEAAKEGDSNFRSGN